MITFSKLHGAGNDFIVINGYHYSFENYFELAHKLCDRHFGIGGDGIILVLPPENQDKNDYRMRIFNADGSEAEMCGNGIRCFFHYLQEKNLTSKKKIKVETKAGIIIPEMVEHGKKKSMVRVNMGKPRFKVDEVPVKIDSRAERVFDYKLSVGQNEFIINCVSMGNPHTIIFTDNVDKIPLKKWGPKIENHEIFPEKTNVEFVEVINEDEIKMRVWERGAGITLACGTGATAAAITGMKKGILDNSVLVHLPGGKLRITWQGDEAYMTGPARTVFEGKIEV